MHRFLVPIALLALAALDMPAARASDAAQVFAQFKTASGGTSWDAVRSLHATGTLHAGGMDGSFESTEELASGRSVSRFRLGPIEGAEGYDGTRGWSRDPGGEVAALDAPEARRRARSPSWRTARGYLYPERIAASPRAVESRELDGRRYDVVVATPDGGDPVTLWFDAATHLLTRVEQAQGQDTATSVYSDWRVVEGRRLPFHVVVDRTDAAGRTDPRQRTEIRYAEVRFDVPVADADFAMPAMTATAHIVGADTTRIPFDLVNNHIYVDAAIDGKPARLLVDTGGVNLLTPAAAAKFGLDSEGQLSARGVGEKAADVGFAHAKQLRLGDAVLDAPVFYVIDLGDLPQAEGVACDGLVGYEMFRRFGVTIDYAKHELVLADPDAFAPPAGAQAVPFALADRIPIVTGTLDGEPVRLSVDTGSRASLSLHSPFVREHDLVARYRAAPEALVGWGVGGAARGRPARFGRLELGDLAIDGIAGDLFTGDKGAFASPDVSGNLGGGVLNRFTVAFDYAARRMYLAPNANFHAADPFDRSGLWLLGDGDALEVVDVAIDSAAARAGLRVGDRIRSIGAQPVAQRPLAEWRRHLRELPVGTQLAIGFLRDAEPARVELVLADRIPATSPEIVLDSGSDKSTAQD
jgi:hypothetical protein